MNIVLICAYGKNREIGKKNTLLWDLPKDMNHFRKRTAGKTVVMGRKTFESIGKILPNRRNIILSREKGKNISGGEIFSTLQEVLKTLYDENPDQEIFIIGGASIYEQFLPFATHLSLTKIDAEFLDADAFFPQWEEKKQEFQKISSTKFLADEQHKFPFEIFEYEKKKK